MVENGSFGVGLLDSLNQFVAASRLLNANIQRLINENGALEKLNLTELEKLKSFLEKQKGGVYVKLLKRVEERITQLNKEKQQKKNATKSATKEKEQQSHIVRMSTAEFLKREADREAAKKDKSKDDGFDL